MWVRVHSHRARGKLSRIMGGELPPQFFTWPKGGYPTGEFYEIPDDKASAALSIKGVTGTRVKAEDMRKAWSMR